MDKRKDLLDSLRSSTSSSSSAKYNESTGLMTSTVVNGFVRGGIFEGHKAFVMDGDFTNYAVLSDGRILSLLSGQIIGANGKVYLSSRYKGKTAQIGVLVAKYVHGMREDQKCLPRDWDWNNHTPDNILVLDAEVYDSVRRKFKIINNRIAE